MADFFICLFVGVLKKNKICVVIACAIQCDNCIRYLLHTISMVTQHTLPS